jgi:hypothetical protein
MEHVVPPQPARRRTPTLQSDNALEHKGCCHLSNPFCLGAVVVGVNILSGRLQGSPRRFDPLLGLFFIVSQSVGLPLIATIGLYQLTNDLAFCLKRVGKLWAIELVSVNVQEDIH